ncbi:MAG: YihY/virulence factor BrkB family protein, partial [Lentisphaeria bacterium]|nr:YihY/virulence factor BrkB family protein [Lentisphaeria bacterium]
DFFTENIWNADFTALRFLKREGYTLCRLLIVAIGGFFEDRCTLQSSALTYITMVSLVPVLAITLSFCKGIGLQRQLLAQLGIETLVMDAGEGLPKTFVYRVVGGAEDRAEAVEAAVMQAENALEEDGSEAAEPKPIADDMPKFRVASDVQPGFAAELPAPMQDAALKLIGYVDHTNFAALGFIGVITLLATAVMSIKKLENNFNDIWCVKRGRSVLRQVSEYLVALLLIPVVLFLVLSLTAFISSGSLASFLHTDSEMVIYWGKMAGKLILFICLITSFMALYLFMPNTNVRLGPALLAGTVTAVAWGVVLLVYVKWQVGLAKYNAIYGTFAALPFFLAWLYTSWLVTLFGAELCYAAQNQRLLRCTKQLRPVEAGANRLLGVAIVESISKHYDEGNGYWNAGEFAVKNKVSIRELEFALASLLKAGLVIQRKPEADPPASYDYMLGRPATQITLAEVSEAFVGLESSTVRRIEKCLPDAFIGFMKARHKIQCDELGKITFDHLDKSHANIENPQGAHE